MDLNDLQSMFPSVDSEVVAIIFSESKNDVEATVEKLLDLASQVESQPNTHRVPNRSKTHSPHLQVSDQPLTNWMLPPKGHEVAMPSLFDPVRLPGGHYPREILQTSARQPPAPFRQPQVNSRSEQSSSNGYSSWPVLPTGNNYYRYNYPPDNQRPGRNHSAPTDGYQPEKHTGNASQHNQQWRTAPPTFRNSSSGQLHVLNPTEHAQKQHVVPAFGSHAPRNPIPRLQNRHLDTRGRFEHGRMGSKVHEGPKYPPPKPPTRDIPKKLIILRGLPGSGKSSLARSLRGQFGVVCSTDDFFLVDGKYVFNPNFLSEYHEKNRLKARKAMSTDRTPVIIDNTNSNAWEMKPYVALAIEYGYDVEILEPDTPWRFKVSELARRNKHGVSRAAIERMLEKYEHRTSVERILNSHPPEKYNTSGSSEPSKDKDKNSSSPKPQVKDAPKRHRDNQYTTAGDHRPPRWQKDSYATTNQNGFNEYKAETTLPDSDTRVKSLGVKTDETVTKGNGRYANQQYHGNWESSRQMVPGRPQAYEKQKYSGKKFSGSKDFSISHNTRKTDFPSPKKDGGHRVPIENTPTNITDTPSQMYNTPSLRQDPRHEMTPDSKRQFKYPSSNNVPSVSEIEADLLGEQWDSSEEAELLNDEETPQGTKQTPPSSATRSTSLARGNGTKERVNDPVRELTIGSREMVGKEQQKVQLEDLFSSPAHCEFNEQKESHTIQSGTVSDQQSLLTWSSNRPLPSIAHNEMQSVGVQRSDAEVQRLDDDQLQTLLTVTPDVAPTNQNLDLGAMSDDLTESFRDHQPPDMSTSVMLNAIVNSQFSEQDVSVGDLSSLLSDTSEVSLVPGMEFPLASENDSSKAVGDGRPRPRESKHSLSVLEAALDSHEDWQTKYLQEAAMNERKSPLHLFVSRLPPSLPLEEHQLLSSEFALTHGDEGNFATVMTNLQESRLIAGLSLSKPSTDDESQMELGSVTNSTIVTALQSNLLEAGWIEGIEPSVSDITSLKESGQASTLFASQLQQDSLSSLSTATPEDGVATELGQQSNTRLSTAQNIVDMKDLGAVSLPRMLGLTTSRHSESIWNSTIATDCQSNSSFDDPAIVQKVHQDRAEDVSETSNENKLLGEDALKDDSELNSFVETDTSNRSSMSSESLKPLGDGCEASPTSPHLDNSVTLPEETPLDPTGEGPRDMASSDSSNSFFSSEEEEIANVSLTGSEYSSANSLEKVVTSTTSVTHSSNSLELFPSAFPSVCETEVSNQDPNMNTFPPGFAESLPKPGVHADVFTTPPQSPNPVDTCASLEEDNPYLFDEDKDSDEGIMFTASKEAQSSSYEDQTESTEETDLKLNSPEYFEATEERSDNYDQSHAPGIHESETQVLLPSGDHEVGSTKGSTELMVSLEGEPSPEVLLDKDEYLDLSEEELRATLETSKEHHDNYSSAKQESDLMFLIGCFPDLEPSYINQLLKKCGDNMEDALSIALVSMATPVPLEKSKSRSPSSLEEFDHMKKGLSSDVKLSPNVRHHGHTFAVSGSRTIPGVQSMCDLPSVTSKFETEQGEQALCVNDEVLARVLQEQLDLEASPEESSSKHFESSVPPTVIEEPDHEETAEGSPGVTEDDNLVLTLSASFAKQLQALFGAVDKHLPHEGKITEDDLKVLLSEKVARGIHQKWIDTLKAKHVEYQYHARVLMEKDEALARDLQNEERRKRPNDKRRFASGPLHPHFDRGKVSTRQHYYSSPIGQRSPRASHGLSEIMAREPRPKPDSHLAEIMDEQLAHEIRNKELTDVVESAVRPNLAMQIQLNQLCDKFPKVNRSTVYDVLLGTNFKFDEAAKQLDTMFSTASHPPGSVDGRIHRSLTSPAVISMESRRAERGDERGVAVSVGASAKDSGNDLITSSEEAPSYQSLADQPSYDELRAEAALHAKLRAENFQKAAKARGQKQWEVAQFFAQKGHLHTQKMKEANRRAATTQLQNTESSGQLDLHGLHVDEALEALQEKLVTGIKGRFLYVITGRGIHSEGQVARIKPAVINLLKHSNYKFEEVNAGMLKVKVKY